VFQEYILIESYLDKMSNTNVRKVILINCGGFLLRRGFIKPRFSDSSEHIGLTTIDNALRQNGFSNTCLFPKNGGAVIDFNGNQREIVNTLRKMRANETGTVFGLSTTSADYPIFIELSKLVRQEFPRAQIIAGGPHFVREKIEGVRDPIEVALEENLADAVVAGHADPFVEFVTKHHGQREKVDDPGFYLWDPAAKKVHGHGYGKFPQLEEVPYIFNPGYGRVSTTWDDTCHNRCGFCTIPASRSPLFPERTVIRTFQGLMPQVVIPAILSLHDSNPFEPERFDYYRTIFEHLPRFNYLPRKEIFIDPSLLVDANYQKKLIDFFDLHSFWSFFIGREVVSEHSSRLIGSNYRGKAKDQFQLDSEREALKQFVAALKRLSPPHRLVLSYILTPFETADSASAVADEIEAFQKLIDDKVNILFYPFPLMPYPGTKLRRKLLDKIADPEDYAKLDMVLNPWKKEIGRSHTFFDYVELFMNSQEQKYLLRNLRFGIDEILIRGRNIADILIS